MKYFKFIVFFLLLFLFQINLFATEQIIIDSDISYSTDTFSNYNQDNQTEKGGVFEVNPTGKLKLDYINFYSNKANNTGGVIDNNGITIINSNIFSENSAAGYVSFGYYSNSSYVAGNARRYGGAIYNNSGTITISSSSFNKNHAGASSYIYGSGYAYGGAIYNNSGTVIISSSVFSDNYSKGLGSASYVSEYSSLIFSGNGYGYGYGGAIYNVGTMIIKSSAFSGNEANGVLHDNGTAGSYTYTQRGYGYGYGGAIYNLGILTISSSVFNSNKAMGYSSGYGGAIFNSGTLTIQSGATFINNSATGNGGAIYNNSNRTINLIADIENIYFTGNKANGVSNAIYDKGGTINLWANENKSIIFNDRITSNDNHSTLNINSSTTTLNAIGKIILNEDMSGFTGDVNLYNGEIELQAKPNSSNINTNKFFSGNVNFSSGTVNVLNNAIDNITINSLISTENINLKIDTDLSNNTSDNFTITNNATGEINLTAINILRVKEGMGAITIFNNKSPELNILTTGIYNGYEYTFSPTIEKGVLHYKCTGTNKTFKEVINDTETYRSFSLARNESLTENLGELGGTQLTIFGNGCDVESSSFEGIFVASDKILNIEDVSSWNGFNNTYGAIKNEGILNVSGTNFTGNDGQDIINNGNLTLSSVSSSFEKGIAGIGTTTINGININLQNAVIEQNRIEINNDGSLITKAPNVIGTIENNSNLILTEGMNNNHIYGTGITTIDGSVINSSTIVNNVTINSQNQLTTNATNISGDITNNGILEYTNGTNENTIQGIGMLLISGEVINNNIINQSSITVNNKLTSKNKIVTKYYLNNGTTINNSTITINGEYYNIGTTINNNYIQAIKYTNKENSQTNNLGTIQVSILNIEENSIFDTDGGELIILDGIENDGEFVLNNGTNDNLIFGNGTTVIDGDVINNSTIFNNIKINENKKLTTKAQDITGNIENNSNLIFSEGINNNYVYGIGTTTIDGEVINSSTIVNNVIINANKKLTTKVDSIIGNIENDGKVLFNNSGTNGNYIFGTGTVEINGEVINSSTIVNNIIINESKKLTTNVNNIIGNIENNGNILFYNNGTNSNYISGSGTTVIDGDVINNSTIFNNIKINGNKQLTTDASNITGNINNLGNYVLNGGENSNFIYGTGITIIDGEVVNSSTIVNNIIINESKKLTTNVNNIIGNIENNGTLLFNSGTTNNNEITGFGTLNIAVDKFINNSTISTENLNLEFVNFKLTENGNLFIKNLSATNSEIDLANSILQEHKFNTLTVNNSLNLSVDADLENKQMDTISANSFSGNGKINVKTINILMDAKEKKTEISFTTSTVLKNKITSVTNASSKLFKYDVNYDKQTGNFNFLITQNSNPIVAESQVARASGLITQTTVLNQAFSSIDNIRDRIIQAKQKGLLYASTTDMLFDNPNRIESGLWIRPFIAQDSISFDSLDVDNTLTGTLAGIDLATGENSLVSFYLGYAGSNQKYENIKVNQAGYLLGATGMFIKDKWYAGITANINFNKAESESDYGTDSFDLNMYSVGAKAGYNFDLSDKFILEPNLTLMYGNVSNQEYETTQGAKIDSQSTANILFEPQVKAKLDLTNGWQPYGLLGYVMNAGEKTKLIADNVAFDDMGISGYVEYGLGLNKTFKNSAWSCYLQATGRSGDINGFNGNLGIKYSFLNKKEKDDIKSIKDTKKKEQEKIKEEQAKQKLIEEERIRKEKEEKAKLEAKEKARIAEENRIKKEEQAKQKAMEEEKIRKEREEKERQKQLEIERKIQENYN